MESSQGSSLDNMSVGRLSGRCKTESQGLDGLIQDKLMPSVFHCWRAVARAKFEGGEGWQEMQEMQAMHAALHAILFLVVEAAKALSA